MKLSEVLPTTMGVNVAVKIAGLVDTTDGLRDTLFTGRTALLLLATVIAEDTTPAVQLPKGQAQARRAHVSTSWPGYCFISAADHLHRKPAHTFKREAAAGDADVHAGRHVQEDGTCGRTQRDLPGQLSVYEAFRR